MSRYSLSTLCLLLVSSVYLSGCSEPEATAPATDNTPSLSETQQKVSEVVNSTKEIVHETTAQAAVSGEELKQETQEKLTEVTSKVLDHTASAAEKVAEKAKALKADVDEKAQQAELKQLAQKSGCLSCHAVDKKLIGPAYQEIAKKYAGQTTAQQQLITSISKGSSGKWGSMAMPANSPRVSDEDIEKLAAWVLSQQ